MGVSLHVGQLASCTRVARRLYREECKFRLHPTVFPFALVVMAAELSEFVQSVESAGKDGSFDEFVINGLAANHITVCVCVLRCCHVLG